MVGAVVVAAIALAIWRPELRAIQRTLETVPGLPSMLWIGVGAFVVANLVLVPLELMTIAAGVLLGARQGGVVALLGLLAAAAVAYAVGRGLGSARLAPWISRRSYRSVSQLGARGVMGVLVLRLASVASAGAIHLLCGAGRVPFAAFLAGTAIGLIPAVAALTGLGALVRHTMLHPSITNALITVGAALALTACAVTLRTFLLIRSLRRRCPAIAPERSSASAVASADPRRDLQRTRMHRHRRPPRSRARGHRDRRARCRHRRAAGVHLSGQCRPRYAQARSC